MLVFARAGIAKENKQFLACCSAIEYSATRRSCQTCASEKSGGMAGGILGTV